MATSPSTVIRVFLSSTFVDFQEERSLLVKQVFPSLRRRARSRGVEIVDVDLRWGVTAEQTERGETLPLCLAEIDRCRPYFISLLGERYGWVPPADPTYYKPALLERQPWLKERMGGASLTELEIMHGVLRHPEMAGHAFFYLRDPAYAQAQPEPGWVADNLQERQRLTAIKEEVRRSGFPVCEGLATPQAIAERIEADLWAVIEREHPEQEPQDPLQREEQRHSDYRRARTGLYLGGETAIAELESWIEAGEQRILITGESGAGKSALIANWLETHQRSHPQDLVYAHHLGCTNDASAIRPLLGRLIDTASLLLLEEKQIAEPLKVPQDWWELVFKVGEVFALLSSWCERQGHRWILALDGLDRLEEEDQQALPWIPDTLPPGIHVVASALNCTARSILQERRYHTHTIGPLKEAEQKQLIECFLSNYTKQLESGLQQRILEHEMSSSPLFLRVLLEELRKCAWHDTLHEQLEFYLANQSIDGLYVKLIERLERDGYGEAARKALTALWASRAGLRETELMEITGLKPLEWAPIELTLESHLREDNGRLTFANDYFRKAIHFYYLDADASALQTRNLIVENLSRAGYNDYSGQDWMELFWQLHATLDGDRYYTVFQDKQALIGLLKTVGAQHTLRYWSEACRLSKRTISIESAIRPLVEYYECSWLEEKRIQNTGDLVNILELLRLEGSGNGDLATRACDLYTRACKDQSTTSRELLAIRELLADSKNSRDSYALYKQLRSVYETQYAYSLSDRLRISLKCAKVLAVSGNYVESSSQCQEVEDLARLGLRLNPPEKIELHCRLADVYRQMFEDTAAIRLLEEAEEMCNFYFGRKSLKRLEILMLLIALDKGRNKELFAMRCQEAFELSEFNLGLIHPICIACQENLAELESSKKKIQTCSRLLELKEARYGADSAEYLFSWACLAVQHLRHGMHEEAMHMISTCYQRHCSHFGEDTEPTLALAFYYSIACLVSGRTSDGLILFSKSLMIPTATLEQSRREMNKQTAERIEDFASFYGSAFAGNMRNQRKEVTRLLQRALTKRGI
jgi:nephrocystin-3